MFGVKDLQSERKTIETSETDNKERGPVEINTYRKLCMCVLNIEPLHYLRVIEDKSQVWRF